MKKLKIEKEAFMELYNEGLNDVAIAKHFNCNAETIRGRRIKWNLEKNFKYTQGISREKLQEYVDQGLSDYKIAKITKINHSWVFQLRKKWGIIVEDKRVAQSVKLTIRQEEVLIGHILGDGNLRIAKECKNVSGSICQGHRQELYAKWKHQELRSLCGDISYRKRNTIDSRTGIYYESYDATILANPELNKLYPLHYTTTGIRRILPATLERYTYLSLAVQFMDDGSKTKAGYVIYTNGFDIPSVQVLQAKLHSFGIIATIHKDHSLYIRSTSKDLFTALIREHIIPSMQYKLH